MRAQQVLGAAHLAADMFDRSKGHGGDQHTREHPAEREGQRPAEPHAAAIAGPAAGRLVGSLVVRRWPIIWAVIVCHFPILGSPGWLRS